MIICRDKSQDFKTRRSFCGRTLVDRKLLTDAPWHRRVSLIHRLLLELINGLVFLNVPHECGVLALRNHQTRHTSNTP